MNDTELREHLDRASAGIQARLDAGTLWQRAERGRRRQRALVAAGTAATVAAVLAVVFALPGTDQEKPIGPSPSPSSSVDPLDHPQSIPPITDDMLQPVFDPARIDELPWRDVVTRSWDPVDAVPLEDDPVEHAVVAHQSNPDQPDAISVLGDDGRWRSLDLTGIELPDSHEYDFGVNRTSLSPDGTRLALGQEQEVLVVDLTTGQRATYETPGLGAIWRGRWTAWSADGDTLFVAASYRFRTVGVAIDVPDGDTSSVPFLVYTSAFLDNGDVMELHNNNEEGYYVRRYDADGNLELTTRPYHPVLGALQSLSAHGDRVAALSEQTTYTDPDGMGPLRSGLLVMDVNAHPEALLPVEGYENHGGGGAVLGWLDDDTVLFQVSGATASALAWEVSSGEITRVADYSWPGGLSIAGMHL